jgi:hypothetical protein
MGGEQIGVLDTGAVHVPATCRFAPGHPRGKFRNKPSDIPGDEDGQQMMQMAAPADEEVWVEFNLSKEIFATAKRYEFSMRYKTDADQEDLQIFLRFNKEEPHYETTLPVPNSDGEWVESSPIPLEHDIGGFKNILLKIQLPNVQGTVLNIRDFKLSPPGADATGEYSAPWFVDWMEELKGKLMGYVLPSMSDGELEDLKAAATKFQDAFKKQCHIDKANKEAKDRAVKATGNANKDCINVATPILESLDSKLQGMDLDNKEMLQFMALVEATPQKLASYCFKGDENVKRLMEFLKEDTELLKEMVVNGGAKGGYYGEALDIYFTIFEKMAEGKPVLNRLALAVALELCEPLNEFETSVAVDPLNRYLQYEKAYLNGKLDPAFEMLTVWEMRMVVDCDAPDAQIEWCRNMMYTYRPDMCYMGDYVWRYVSIVKTDVKFGKPGQLRCNIPVFCV